MILLLFLLLLNPAISQNSSWWVPIFIKSIHWNIGIGHQWYYHKISFTPKQAVINYFAKQSILIGSPANLVEVDENFKNNYENIANPPIRQDNKIIIPLKKPYFYLKKISDDHYILLKNEDNMLNSNDIFNNFESIDKNIMVNNPGLSNYNFANYHLLSSSNAVFSNDNKFITMAIKDDNNQTHIYGDNNLKIIIHKKSLESQDKISLVYPSPIHHQYDANYLKNLSYFKIDNSIDNDDLLNNVSFFITTLNFVHFMRNFFIWDKNNMILDDNNYRKFFDKDSLLNLKWWEGNKDKTILKYMTPETQEKTQFIKEAFNINTDFAPLSYFNSDCASFLQQIKQNYCLLLNCFLWFTIDSNFSLKNKKIGRIGLDFLIVYYINDYGQLKNFSTEDFTNKWAIYGFIKFLILKYKFFRGWIGFGFNYHYKNNYYRVRSNIQEKNVHELIDNIYKKIPVNKDWQSFLHESSWMDYFSVVIIFYIFRMKLILIVNPITMFYFKMFNIYGGVGYNLYYTNYKNQNIKFLQSLVNEENRLYEYHMIKEKEPLGVLYT